MSFAGSVVQLPRDRVASGLGEIIHAAAFPQILPDQSVGIFVSSPLPRVVGVGEVELHAGLFLQIAVGVKLAAIVGGDRQESLRVLLHQFAEPLVRGRRRPCLELSDEHIAGLSVYDRGDAAPALSVDGVHLPVPDLGASLRFGRAVLDPSFPRQTASGVVVAVALASLLACSPQVLIERASRLFVPPDVAVNGLVADAEAALESQPSGDLFGAVILPYQRLDLHPLKPLKARALASSSSATTVHWSGMEGPVAAVGRVAVAGELAADGGGGSPEPSRDLPLAAAGVFPLSDQRSLLVIQVFVGHAHFTPGPGGIPFPGCCA
jgi:hypothetical protein